MLLSKRNARTVRKQTWLPKGSGGGSDKLGGWVHLSSQIPIEYRIDTDLL